MAAVVIYGYGSVVVYDRGDDDGAVVVDGRGDDDGAAAA